MHPKTFCFCFSSGNKRYLIYSSDQRIKKIVLNSVKRPVELVSRQHAGDVTEIAYDVMTNMIYWVESRSHRIMRAYSNGSIARGPAIQAELQPYDIAIDPYGRQLYFTDAATNKIYVYGLRDDKMMGAVVAGKLKRPKSILLYPEKG